jgi:hypothetical protein
MTYRWIMAVVVMAAGPAHADPEPQPQPAPIAGPERAGARGDDSAGADDSAAAPPSSMRLLGEPLELRLGNMRSPAITATVDRPVDLFPPTVFGERGRFTLGDGGANERRPGINLGNDGDWRVQAAQVGVMVGGFAALAALCGSGACRLPGVVDDLVPDFLRSHQVVPELRAPIPLRQAR